MTKKFVLMAVVAALLVAFTGCTTEPEAVTVTVTASEETDTSDEAYVKFTFTFNQDVSVDSVLINIPTIETPHKMADELVGGEYEGDAEDDFPLYWLDQGEFVVIKGDYSVTFYGVRSADDEPFSVSADVTL